MNFFKSYKTYTDEKLMRLIQQNDVDAFDELHKRYSKRLLHFMFKMLGNNEERAQDLLQDLFLKIVERPHLFDTTKKFYTWVFAVAANMCRTEYRNSNRKMIGMETIEKSEPVAHEDLVETVDAVQFTTELDAALNSLSFEEKETFVLRFQQDFGLQEIAVMMNCPEGTVKSRIYYTTRKLAAELHVFKSLLKQ